MSSDDTFTAEVPKRTSETPEYQEWINGIDATLSVRVNAALEKIESEGIITSAKSLGDGFFEKKWKSGLRLYFAVTEDPDGKATLLLLGSGKGKGQEKAILRSREALIGRKVFKGNIEKKD